MSNEKRVDDYFQRIAELSLGSTPEVLLKVSLNTCIELAGAKGGSILGEEGPFLQFLFSDVADLIGARVPHDSIAGITVNDDKAVYTFAPSDKRHYAGIDAKLQRRTRYLLSLPIPSIHNQSAGGPAGRNAGALQLLFDEDINSGVDVAAGPQEFAVSDFKRNDRFMERFRGIFAFLPMIAFGLEVLRIRQASYQAIHELKNKLISGASWMGCLRDDLAQAAPQSLEDGAVKEDFEVAETALREGAELAKTYLQFTKLYTPEFKPCAIGDVLTETAASVRALASELHAEGFKVVTEIGDGIPMRPMDAAQLKMAFFNLCKNAVEALVSRGTPSPEVRIACVAQGARISVTIQDNGPGMPPEIADQLFVPFKTKKEGGTGLGLTIAKKIIDIHGGTIRCETGGWGTRFTIVF